MHCKAKARAKYEIEATYHIRHQQPKIQQRHLVAHVHVCISLSVTRMSENTWCRYSQGVYDPVNA